MNREEALQSVENRFIYTLDGKWDTWNITKGAGPIRDDCDGFALTLLYVLAKKNLIRFWFYVLTFQAVFWFVRTQTGDGHLVLWFRGSWADNMMPHWYKTQDMPHRRRYPIPPPILAIKMLFGKFL